MFAISSGWEFPSTEMTERNSFHDTPSGIFVNSMGPPLIEGYKLTFTKAGTYKYICTVHDDMKGTVVVG